MPPSVPGSRRSPLPALPLVLSLFCLCLARDTHAVAPPSDAARELELPRLHWTRPPVGYEIAPEGARRLALERLGTAPRATVLQDERRAVADPEEGGPVARRQSVAASAWARLTEEGSVRGRVTWSSWTGAPHRIEAAGWRWPAASGLETPEAAEAAARAFVLAHADLLLAGEAPTADELPLVKRHRVGDVWLLVFGQRFRGLEVVDGRVDVRIRVDGSVPLAGSQWFAGVDVPTAPLVHRSAAAAAAMAAIGGDPLGAHLSGGDLAVLPLPGEEGPLYRLVHRIRHESREPIGVWTSWVDALDGTVWARENAVRYLNLSGTVTSDILPVSPEDPFEVVQLPYTIVRRAADSTTTNLTGAYTLPGVTAGEQITTPLRSLFLEVFDASGPEGSLSAFAPAVGPLDFHWTYAGGDTAEGNAFYHGLVVHDYVRALDPGFTDVDYRMPCTVNLNATCNAFWDGVGINFFRTGGGCANTGNIADVVYHEYGHGVTQFTFDPFFPNGAMHEGFSDYLASTMTRQPVIGRGFFGPGTSIRTSDNTRTLPAPECFGEPHCLGTAVAGALWDMQGNFAASLGDSGAAQALADSLWHFAGFGGAYWYDDYLLDLLLVDDNDGTLLNGTPHFGDICAAFEAHGFVCPDTTSGVWVVHDPLGDTDPGAVPYGVSAEMGSFAALLAPGLEKVHYRVNEGPWSEAALSPAGGDLYQGSVPALPSGGRLDYYLTAQDQGGLTASHPSGAPAEFHTFFVGTEDVIFADDFEGDQGWEPNGGNTAATGRWLRVDPHGTSDGGFFYQTEDDHTANPGVLCFVTGDTTAGLAIGLEDVDGGCVYLVSPRIDLSGLSNARLEYWRWFTNENRIDDTLRVEISSDDGATWTLLEAQPFTQNLWVERSIELTAYAALTDSMRLRVTACDLGGPSLTEAAFDDVRIVSREFESVDSGPGPILAGFWLAQSIPNPTRGEAVIAFSIPGRVGDRVPVRLALYDARGRRVRELLSESMSPGPYRVAWDGRDDAGRRAAAGVYLYRLSAAGEERTLKLQLTP